MNTWLLLLNIIIHTPNGPVVYLDTIEVDNKIDCERVGNFMRDELLRYRGGKQASVTTTCILKSQRIM